MNTDLRNKRALVCGSTQGLGLACAKELALLGANVILMARNEEKLKEAVNGLPVREAQQHDFLVADFQFPEQVEKAIYSYLEKGNIVHILVNNTGGPKAGTTHDAKPEDFIAAFRSHLICNQLLAQAVIPGMKADAYGRIVNVISTSVKQPIAGLAVSNTIRGAVASWAKTLANETGEFGITVNNVLPGYTRTARYDSIVKNKMGANDNTEAEVEAAFILEIPLKRIGRPEEFGAAVAFLCTPAAGYISGINLPVDGGKLGCL